MVQMDGFAEAAAVHRRVGQEEYDGYDGKYYEEHAAGDCKGLAPYSGDQGCAQQGFEECQDGGNDAGCRFEEGKMEEVEVLIHHQAGTHGIHQFEKARDEQDHPENHHAYSPESVHNRLSTNVLILANISSGGSIPPSALEQSTTCRLLSTSAWRRYMERTFFWNSMSASWMSWA